MGKTAKVVVIGKKGVGKTAILEQAIYGKLTKSTDMVLPPIIKGIVVKRTKLIRSGPHKDKEGLRNVVTFLFLQSTIEDVYVANVETDRGVKEKLRFYDTGSDVSSNINFQHADGFILVFDPAKMDTLDFIMASRKDIERCKERKEAIIVVIANHSSRSDPLIVSKAQSWTARDKLKYYDASAMDRASLYEAFTHLASRLSQQVAKSSFGQLAMRKRD